jgi:predicted  nucleic acid-binding Zn-ribbon protein
LSDGIKAQYQTLADLKRVDEKIFRLEHDIEQIPQEIEKFDQALQTRRQDYEKVKASFEGSEKRLRQIESDLKDREDKLHKAEGKMMEVKTNEEYKAAIKENDTQKSEKSGVEEQVLLLMNQLDENKSKLKQAESEFKTYETTVQGQTGQLESDRTKLVNMLEVQMQARATLSQQLTPDVRAVYQRVCTRIKGVPVVSVENGMCLGCHMKMRAQLFNEVLGFKAIHRCPSCGKILIISPKETQIETEAG